ncbi:kinetochore-associated Ndc80 complex subunit spc25 [Ceratobasidium sp. 392]|nr:kinetochore-associated Ndc80 complex subunit spc25 [Ceratobasidium sp. 392]
MATTRQATRPALVTDLRKTLAQQNPVIPLHFESTQDKMVAFKSALTAYVTSGQTEIARRKDKYETLQRREKNKITQMNAEIEQFRVDEMNLLKKLKTEQEEKAEAEAQLGEYDARLKDIEENRVAVDVELEGLRAKTEKLKLEKSKDQAKLERQVALNEPEARTLEDALKWNVEGVERNVVRIKFTHVDQANPAREFSFVVRMAFQQYVEDERRAMRAA